VKAHETVRNAGTAQIALHERGVAVVIFDQNDADRFPVTHMLSVLNDALMPARP
jgi:hypothetical protein